MSVLIAALFTFGSPVQAEDSVNAQNQQNILGQAATTQGVPLLGIDDDEDTDQSAAGDDSSAD